MNGYKTVPNIANAIYDVTERDLIRRRYYQLLAEQTEWNAIKQQKRKTSDSRKHGIIGFLLLLALIVIINFFNKSKK